MSRRLITILIIGQIALDGVKRVAVQELTLRLKWLLNRRFKN